MSLNDKAALLRRYADYGDEAAFRELVAQYVDLVYSTAVRRVNGDAELARDVTQTVFADLARKASSLSDVQFLGGWLHRHTGFVAATVIRSERRRQTREKEAAEMNLLQNASDSGWQQLAPVLDETIDSLDAADRQAILLRFFERRDFRAIGDAMGMSDDAAQKRVSRALEKLRSLLAERGVTFTVALLASLMAGRAVSAAPAGMAAETARAGLAGGSAGGLALLIAKLANSVALKVAAGIIVAGTVAWLVSSGGLTQGRDSARQGNSVAALADTAVGGAETSNAVAPAAAMESSIAAVVSSSNHLTLTIVTADSGKPVPNVELDYWLWRNDDVKHLESLRADRMGVCEVPVPEDTTQLILVSQSDGFADTRLDWKPSQGEKIPAQYTLRVVRAVSIGGTVVNSEGNPVADAKVSFGNRPDVAVETRPECNNFGWPYYIETKSGLDGSWRIERIGKETLRTVSGSASHPEYVESRLDLERNPELAKPLLAGTYTFQLGDAAVVRGIVIDPEGQPVPGAQVLVGQRSVTGSREGVAGPDGTFALAGCKPGKNLLTAEAEGYAATTMGILVETNSEPFRLTLAKGKLLKVRIVDPENAPIAKASLWIDTINFRSSDSVVAQTSFSPKTDADGRIEWNEAPGEELRISINASGFMRQESTVVPDGTEHVITLQPAFKISGTVRDATTGQPIPRFRIITGWPQINFANNTTNAQWSGIDRFWLSFEGGKFRYTYEEAALGGTADPAFVFKFEAEGYAPFVTRVVNAKEREIQFDVALRPAITTEVTVLLPDGRPAGAADVGLVSKESHLEMMPGRFSRQNVHSGGSLLLADGQGRFRLPFDDAITSVIAVHAQGCGEASIGELTANPVLQLKPWGRIEGTYSSCGEPMGDRIILFQYRDGDFQKISTSQAFETRTDKEGRFTFPQVPAGTHRLVWLEPIQATPAGVDGMAWTHRPLTDVVIRSGEMSMVAIGASNYCVTAHLRWPPELKREPGWKVLAIVHRPLPVPLPSDAATNPVSLVTWREIPDVTAVLAVQREYPVILTNDGLIARDVPAGNYLLNVSVLEDRSQGEQPRLNGRVEVPFSIPPDPPSGQLDLGEITIQPAGD